MSDFAVLSPKGISQLTVSRAPVKAANPVKHHSHAGGRQHTYPLIRVGDTVYRRDNGKSKGTFISKKKYGMAWAAC